MANVRSKRENGKGGEERIVTSKKVDADMLDAEEARGT